MNENVSVRELIELLVGERLFQKLQVMEYNTSTCIVLYII